MPEPESNGVSSVGPRSIELTALQGGSIEEAVGRSLRLRSEMSSTESNDTLSPGSTSTSGEAKTFNGSPQRPRSTGRDSVRRKPLMVRQISGSSRVRSSWNPLRILSKRQSNSSNFRTENHYLQVHFQKPSVCDFQDGVLLTWSTYFQQAAAQEDLQDLVQKHRKSRLPVTQELSNLPPGESQRVFKFLRGLPHEAELMSMRKTINDIEYKGMTIFKVSSLCFVVSVKHDIQPASGLFEQVRRASRAPSQSRIRTGLPIIVAGLGRPAIAGLYQKQHERKKDEKGRETIKQANRRSRSGCGSVSMSSAVASEPGIVEYGEVPDYSNGGYPDYYNRATSPAGYYQPLPTYIQVAATAATANKGTGVTEYRERTVTKRIRNRETDMAKREFSPDGSDSERRREHRRRKGKESDRQRSRSQSRSRPPVKHDEDDIPERRRTRDREAEFFQHHAPSATEPLIPKEEIEEFKAMGCMKTGRKKGRKAESKKEVITAKSGRHPPRGKERERERERPVERNFRDDELLATNDSDSLDDSEFSDDELLYRENAASKPHPTPSESSHNIVEQLLARFTTAFGG